MRDGPDARTNAVTTAAPPPAHPPWTQVLPWPVPLPNPEPIGVGGVKPELPKVGAALRPWPAPRPLWAWPPGVRPQWAVAPGTLTVSWMWPPEAPETTIKIASMTIAPAMTPRSKPPPWRQDVSETMAATISVLPWPPLPPPDFRTPQGHGRFAVPQPPARFVRWADRLETVLPAGEVVRSCQAAGAKSAPRGKVIRGCAHLAAGRCFIIRVDDPGVARHELAHCNGWRHE